MATHTSKRIAVIGSRDFDDYERLKAVVIPHLPATLISGGAKGADAIAERFATKQELPIDVVPADWERYGGGRVSFAISRLWSRRILSSRSGTESPMAHARPLLMPRKLL